MDSKQVNLRAVRPSELLTNRQLNQFPPAAGWWEEQITFHHTKQKLDNDVHFLMFNIVSLLFLV